jgi:peptide/nickel transport system substrate-binding protein
MKHFVWRWFAASSLLTAALVAAGEARPQYGGALHIGTHTVIEKLDPAEADSPTQINITGMLFETLVTVDDRERAQPVLAVSWQVSRDNCHWHFQLRSGVKFHDGIVLTPAIAAESLQAANPSWHLTADGDSILIDTDAPDPELLAKLDLPRNAIVDRGPDGVPTGTGPFRVAEWQSGRRLSLAANDDYWGGRPFLDSIEIEMNQTDRDQMTAFQSGKADLIEVAPEQAQRLSIDRQDLHSSLPIALLAVVFTRDPQSSSEKSLRQALALSIDRSSIGSVLLQGAGLPASSMLPNWMTGYAFIFSSQTDVAQARRIRDQAQALPTWTLGYDPTDLSSRLIAERIALNARDAGLSVRPAQIANPDMRLMRIPLQSTDPWSALVNGATIIGLNAPAIQNDSVENLYAAEQLLLATERIVPLFHLPVIYAISPAVKGCKVRKDGTWNLADAWLEIKP